MTKEIRLKTPIDALDNLLKQAAKILYDNIMSTLAYLGEDCVSRVRDRTGDESWYDQTGNLRSSIGYAIYSYGYKQIESAFSVVKNGSEGASYGKKFVEELAKQYSDVYALVVVAAMDYADYVEAVDSKDVLASTEIYAKSKIDEYLRKAIQKSEQEIQRLEVRL